VVRGGLAGVRSGWNVDVELGLTNQEEPEERWGTQLHKSRRHHRRGKADDMSSRIGCVIRQVSFQWSSDHSSDDMNEVAGGRVFMGD